MGQFHESLGRITEALPHFEAATTILEKHGGGAGAEYRAALLGVGCAKAALGQPRQAIPFLERALRLAVDDVSSQALRDLGETRFELAKALWTTGDRSPRVADLAHAAIADERRAGYEEKAREVEEWLARQGRR